MQRITVTPSGIDGASASGEAPSASRSGSPRARGSRRSVSASTADGHVPSTHEAQLVAALAPAHLRVEARLDDDRWRDNLRRGREVARRLGAALEVSLQLRPEHAELLPEVGETLAGGPKVECVHVTLSGSRTSTPEETTPSSSSFWRAPGSPARSPARRSSAERRCTSPRSTARGHSRATWDGVCFSITPQIHAFTDVDLIENLDAQGENVRTAHALAGEKPIHVSPVTIRRRVNFHAATPDPEPGPGELPDAVDPRQASLLGAAWTVGSLKYLAEAGAAAVTYYETTGWRGVVERDEGTSLPERFHSRAGEPFPLYHPLADATGWRDAEVIECESEDPACRDRARGAGGWRTALLLANVTPYPQEVVVGPLEGQVALRRLDAAAAAEAGSAPESFRASSESVEVSGELALRLEPYEVVRVDPAG